MNTPDLLAALEEACVATVVKHNEFWVLAALTDRSWEEGTRSNKFKICVDTYQAAGTPETLITHLCLGINGNLREEYQVRLPPGYRVRRNKGRGQDLLVFDDNDEIPAMIESKLIYDLTGPKHYTTTAKDFQKLQTVRGAGFQGHLFLVVFFVQMPNHNYSGCLDADNDRAKSPGTRGIRDQYQLLRSRLPVQPVWPLNPPHIESIAWAHDFNELKKWHTAIFNPTAVWSFEPGCLVDAKVGMAIWQCP